jgi:hypothetical protein
MSVADYFLKKCADATNENIKLLEEKLADPSSIVDVEVSGALADASSLGDLASIAGDYLENNAGGLMVAALGVAGLQNSVLGGLNLFMNLLAQAVSLYNDLILIFLKKLAEQIVSGLNAKIAINTTLIVDLTKLVNAIDSLNKGPQVFDEYLTQLRAALILLDKGRKNIKLTRDTLSAQDLFLTKTFRKGRSQVFAAQSLIKPLANNPYLQPTAASLGLNIGIPTQPQQIANLLAIPKLCKKIIDEASSYGVKTLTVNAQLTFYFDGLELLQTNLPNILKQQIISLFDNVLHNINTLQVSMGKTLNGAQGAVLGPVSGFTPVPLKVSVTAFKWMLDINLIANALKLIPSDIPVVSQTSDGILSPAQKNVLTSGKPASQGEFAHVKPGDNVTITGGKFAQKGDYVVMAVLSSSAIKLDRVAYFNAPLLAGQTPAPNDVSYSIYRDGALATFALNQGLVRVYTDSITAIKKKGNRGGTAGKLIANEGQENFAILQIQLVSFMAQILGGLFTTEDRLNLIAEGHALINHCKLSIQQDTEIINILNTFINTPIPLEDLLNQIQAGLIKMLKDLGLDKAADLLQSGDFKSFFNMNGKNATYIGAALEALALLKACFKDPASLNKFTEVENSIKGDQDLLNIKLNLNFNLAIAANIKACTDLTALAALFNQSEFQCFLAGQAGVAAQMAGAAISSAATTAAGAITGAVGAGFDALNNLLTFPDSPPTNVDSVPAPPAGVATDTAAVALAAKTI